MENATWTAQRAICRDERCKDCNTARDVDVWQISNSLGSTHGSLYGQARPKEAPYLTLMHGTLWLE
ncbi:MAG: hypothetical protein ACI9Y1_000035 [Lentisphaeria bacterium]|jgi:hypothetical protein